MKQSRNSKALAWVVAVVVAMTAISSCDDATIYDSYHHTSVAGWDRSDTLFFDMPPAKQTGDYMEEVGIRLSGNYPFMELCLIVEQTVIPSNMMRTDTIVCNVANASGSPRGHGVNYYQHQLPIGSVRLAEGDSLHVTVHHHMRREILLGVADVGLKISKSGNAR